MTDPADLQNTKRVSEQLGACRYEVIEKVGQGGMSVVYRARHRALEKEVALKVLSTDRHNDRFLREAKLQHRSNPPMWSIIGRTSSR